MNINFPSFKTSSLNFSFLSMTIANYRTIIHISWWLIFYIRKSVLFRRCNLCNGLAFSLRFVFNIRKINGKTTSTTVVRCLLDETLEDYKIFSHWRWKCWCNDRIFVANFLIKLPNLLKIMVYSTFGDGMKIKRSFGKIVPSWKLRKLLYCSKLLWRFFHTLLL